jgi:LPXTG-site transpeptidase (sortase) family protein
MTFLLTLVLAVNPVHARRPEQGTSISIPSMGIYAEIFSMNITQQSGKPIWYIAPWEERIGHLEQTAWLGENGNIVMGAHSTMPDGSWGVFSFLPYVEIGEQIIINENGVDFTFVVQEVLSVDYNDISIVDVDENRLTLITCFGGYDTSIDDYRTRAVVIAVPVEQ